MTNMKRKWLFVLSVLFGLVLLGFACYLLTPKPAALSITSRPAPTSNDRPGTAAFETEPGRAALSPLGRTPSRHATESSTDTGPSRDFSGVMTIDPTISSTVPTPEKTPEKNASSAPLPLVFQPVDSNTFKMNPNEKEILDRLQQNFLDEIGGTDQDPSDPLYLARWKKARSLIDAQLQAQLGQDFFQRYQIEAIQQAAREK